MPRRPLSLPAERDGHPAPPALIAVRAALDTAIAGGAFAADPPPRTVSLGGVTALRFDPPGVARGTVLHCHGGGFRLGRPEQVAPFAAALAAAGEVTVICPRYRLAPENPFPAGLSDAAAVHEALIAQGHDRIVLSGDSAGGGIAAGLAALTAGRAVPPVGLLLLSPWLDLTLTSPAFEGNAGTDPFFSRDAATQAAALYLQGLPADDPLASPLHGSVAGFPSTLLVVGDGEVLIEDAVRFDAMLAAAGIASRLRIVPGMEHVAVTRGRDLVGAADSFADLIRFLRGVL